jgi:hypothetical protein
VSNIPDFVRRGAERSAAEATPTDRLDRVRRTANRWRDLDIKKKGLEEQLAAVQADITRLETKELVDVLTEAKMPKFTLEAEGNYPAATFEKKPFYSAKIPEDREGEAFAWFEAEGHADLIKTEFKVAFGMGDYKRARKLESSLTRDKFEYSKKVGVAAPTLLSFVKKEVEKNHAVPADLLGVFVGEVVKVKFSAARAADTRGED